MFPLLDHHAAAASPSGGQLDALRREVRTFVSEQLRAGMVPRVNNWMAGFSPDFSRRVAERGWIGMTWPGHVGGGERTELERFVVTEELVAAGAPVAAHWGADRQIGSTLLRYGSPELQAELLPRFAKAELFVCAGMSEPEAGSDLAALRCRAVPVEGGYRLSGTKVWVSHAHRSDLMVVLCRTDPESERSHGLSQVIVDLGADGITVRPIRLMTGEEHFNEVTFEDVFVPDDRVIGEPGQAWEQLRSELVLERCGPDRYLSTFPLLDQSVVEPRDEDMTQVVGDLAARIGALRGTSMRILERGVPDADRPLAAAVVKDQGTLLEQELVERVRAVRGDKPPRLLAEATLSAPMFTLRGGSTEILRTIIARTSTAGSRPSGDEEEQEEALLFSTAQSLLESLWPESITAEPEPVDVLWGRVAESGLARASVPESVGGAGGDDAFGFLIAKAAGHAAAPVPLVETNLLAGWLLGCAGIALPDGPMCLGLDRHRGLGGRLLPSGELELTGRLHDVAWLPAAQHVVLAVPLEEQEHLAVAHVPVVHLEVEAGHNLADEPIGAAILNHVVPPEEWSRTSLSFDTIEARGALARAAQIAGAVEEVLKRTRHHAEQREQFGRPLLRFQAVEHLVARLVEHMVITNAAVSMAVQDPSFVHIATSKVVAGRAAYAAAAAAHQVHGAIGVTLEHPLARFTRRLLVWRDDYGSEHYWTKRLGRTVLDRLDESLWAAIIDRHGAPQLWGSSPEVSR